MILNIFSHLLMSRMLLSSSFVLLFLLCLSLECNGRHLNSIDEHSMDNKAKLLSHSTIKGFGMDPFTFPDDLNLKMTDKSKDQLNVDNDHMQADCGSKNKEMIKDQKVKKVKEELVQRHHHEHRPKLVTYRVPPKNKRVHQQPGFNLDYSPPKTHPPSHN